MVMVIYPAIDLIWRGREFKAGAFVLLLPGQAQGHDDFQGFLDFLFTLVSIRFFDHGFSHPSSRIVSIISCPGIRS